MSVGVIERVCVADVEACPPRGARRPSRWNNAGLCVACVEFGCSSPRCERWWLASLWMICPDCDGHEWRDITPCGCFAGVVEADFPGVSLADDDPPLGED